MAARYLRSGHRLPDRSGTVHGTAQRAGFYRVWTGEGRFPLHGGRQLARHLPQQNRHLPGAGCTAGRHGHPRRHCRRVAYARHLRSQGDGAAHEGRYLPIRAGFTAVRVGGVDAVGRLGSIAVVD